MKRVILNVQLHYMKITKAEIFHQAAGENNTCANNINLFVKVISNLRHSNDQLEMMEYFMV